MTAKDRQLALEYGMYMVIQQDLALGGGKCITKNTPYIEKMFLAWSELAETLKESDCDICEETYDNEVQKLLTPEFYEESIISIMPKQDGSGMSDIEISTGRYRYVVNVTFSGPESIKVKKFFFHDS